MIESCNAAAESLIINDSRFVVEPLVMVNSPSFDFRHGLCRQARRRGDFCLQPKQSLRKR